jgi:hypothetical protein
MNADAEGAPNIIIANIKSGIVVTKAPKRLPLQSRI